VQSNIKSFILLNFVYIIGIFLSLHEIDDGKTHLVSKIISNDKVYFKKEEYLKDICIENKKGNNFLYEKLLPYNTLN